MRLRDAVMAVRQTGDFTPLHEAIPYTRFMGITAELVNDDRYDSYEKIFYELQGEEKAVFIFHTIRGPDSAAIYNIHEDTFWYEP